MGATYTRQSTFTDGDIITAAHSNDEFNQLLAAFAASTGHTHDGTTAEGGPITKLLGDTLTFGTGSDTDIAITFDGNTSDGVLTWKEDEDYFEFSDDILIASSEKLQFRDTAIHISSSTDGQLDLVADGAVLVDTAGDITLDADGGDVVLKDGGTQFASLTNASGNLIIKSGSTTAMTFDGANVTFAGTVTIGSAGISEAELEILDGATVTTDELNILDGVTATTAELNIMDGVTATTAEINIMDGDTSATSTTVADADRVVLNDNGTMKQVAVTDLSAYFDDEITAMPNLVTVSTLDSGAISSGFGNIDIGSSNLTATGTISLGATSFNDNAITNVGDIALDSISADGTDINVAVSDNSATAFTIKQGSDNYLVIDTANSSESVSIGTGISGPAKSIGHSTSETTVKDNLTVTGDLTVKGATTTVDTTNTTVKDNLLELNSGASSNSNDSGIIIQRGSTGNDALFMWDESEDKFALGTTTDNASSTGNLNMTTGTLVANIEGNVTGNVTGNVSGTAATVTVSAQSNITSLGTLTTLTVDNIIVNGTTIGHTDDTDLITLADGIATVAGEISVTTLDIGGTNVTSTAAELNIMDGGTAASSTTLVDADRVVTNDDGTMKQVALTDVKTYLTSAGFTTDDPTALAIALG